MGTMGRAESFNEYAMIRSALEETARKIQAREESIERQRELLLAEEDTVKRGKMMEKIDRERRAVERERKSLKALEEKAERTARKGGLTDEDRQKAERKGSKERNPENGKEAKSASESKRMEAGAAEKSRKEKDRKAAGSKLEGKEAETAEKKAKEKEDKSSERKAEKEGNQNSQKSEKSGAEGRINDMEKNRPSNEKGELEEKIRDAKRTSSGKHSPAKFAKKSPRDLSLEIADARERLHIAEDHFKNSLNTQTNNAFVRTRKEE